MVRALFTIAGLHPESGGPSRSVTELCAALARAGVEVEIVSLNYGKTFQPPLVQLEKSVRVTFVDCSGAIARRAQWTSQFKTMLHERCRETGVNLVHDTGMWLLTNHAAASVCGNLNLPRIVSPRGMLTQWALQHKGWKKRVAWWLYQQRDLQAARLLHATSDAEVRSFRAAGLNQPVAMIPNGVETPPPPISNLRFPISDLRTLLFLGRIHPVKGLLDLVEAWARLKPTGWRVIVAGRDEAGHAAQVQAAIRERGLVGDFEFVGPVTSEGRWNLYRRADLFVLPSHSENFGIVVAEALACSVPVITTRGTPWEDLVTRQCGWWTEIGVTGLTAGLRDALARPEGELLEMGRRGQKLVAEKYGWSGIATRMHAVYRWMLGAAEKPACVIE